MKIPNPTTTRFHWEQQVNNNNRSRWNKSDDDRRLNGLWFPMSTLIGIRGDANDGLYSPAKEKAANRGAYISRSPLLLRRVRQLLVLAKVKVILGLCALCVVVLLTSRLSSFMGWNPQYPSSVSSPSRYLYLSFLFIL